jgi:oxygen-independent coproporphyrinogen-3 oxidase
MTLSLDKVDQDRLGLYLSIPFCRSKCTYCNFASGVYPASEHARYVDRLIEDMRLAPAWAAGINAELPRRLDTVYLGGGTPSLLAPALLEKLFAAMRQQFEFDADAEITVECAPGQISDEVLAAFQRVGVNRVSLGVQSFIDKEAHASGRLHDREIVISDLARLRSAGIANINLDLIAGLAGQTFASWDESVGVLLETNVPHVSIYMFEVDEDSRLGRELLGGGARYSAGLVPSGDAMAQMYTEGVARLAQAGLAQYEISNFARPGSQSRHNMRYWRRRPYLGLGLDASSSLRGRDGVLRFTSTSELKEYLLGPAEPAEMTLHSLEQQHEEAWFLGLRLNDGVSVESVEREFGAESTALAMKIVHALIDRELLTFDGSIVQLTDGGRLLSNDVFQEFLEMQLETETAFASTTIS